MTAYSEEHRETLLLGVVLGKFAEAVVESRAFSWSVPQGWRCASDGGQFNTLLWLPWQSLPTRKTRTLPPTLGDDTCRSHYSSNRTNEAIPSRVHGPSLV